MPVREAAGHTDGALHAIRIIRDPVFFLLCQDNLVFFYLYRVIGQVAKMLIEQDIDILR